jgi:RNase P subunit RPR2
MTSVVLPKKWKNCRILLIEKHKSFENVWSGNRAARREIQNTEFLAKRQQISVNNNQKRLLIAGCTVE